MFFSHASVLPALLLAVLPALAAPASSASASPSATVGTTSAVTAGSAGSSSSGASAAQVTPAFWVDIEEFAKLHSDDKNEGSGDGQKRPYGITGPNAVKFKFNGDDYKEETFKISYYKSSSWSMPSGTYNPEAWTTASGTATKVIECVATASASLTENAWLVPTPDISTTTGGVGSGDGQKRPYGITGPNEVKFTFGDPVDYKEETFRVTFYETQTTWPAVATETGSDYDQNWWTINQGEPTKVIECVATATSSVTEAVDVYPTPDLAITDGPVNVKCTDVS
ncbi:hypothetical protein L202_01998 [Cryptococcus amylolentus CBS 6039]|uniref:GH16 domain-containing protein n=1 Tax=Cryptococcus amylolentus CBS 6039 TaxID=1295533 RepID=A0A1E3HZH3_9TREE|nr:hypothetical protein L202_01998 [Cryptococcus amylolentus CBS 6039]ODN81585.1 hypothetical protein L202_01998 [Cryptococcus amylolentus CBS 6039]